jgi:hypothetical protein
MQILLSSLYIARGHDGREKFSLVFPCDGVTDEPMETDFLNLVRRQTVKVPKHSAWDSFLHGQI